MIFFLVNKNNKHAVNLAEKLCRENLSDGDMIMVSEKESAVFDSKDFKVINIKESLDK